MVRGKRIHDNLVSKPALYDWMGFLHVILGLYKAAQIADNWDRCKNEIQDYISDPALTRVLLEFGNEAFPDDDSKIFPDYDGFFDFINEEINKKHADDHNGFEPMFSWLSEDAQLRANQDILTNPLPNIRSEIAKPRSFSSSL